MSLLFLCTGAGLTLHIAFGVPLPAGMLGVGALTVLTLRAASREAVPPALLRAGLLSGLAATAAYDVGRLAVVEAGDLGVSPFAAIPHFGAALTSASAPEVVQTAVGAAFHVTNGVFFAVAFTFFLGGRGVLWGIAWGLGLELAMLTLYPVWLQISLTGEFTAMSLTGHVCYGATLALMARTLLRAEARRRGR